MYGMVCVFIFFVCASRPRSSTEDPVEDMEEGKGINLTSCGGVDTHTAGGHFILQACQVSLIRGVVHPTSLHVFMLGGGGGGGVI